MSPMSEFPFRRVHFSRPLVATFPAAVQEAVKPLLRSDSELNADTARSLAVLYASEVIRESSRCIPRWTDTDTLYLVVADVPEPALMQIPTILRIHKPDQRIHITRHEEAGKRQAIALARDHAFEGIVDAYVVWSDLYVVLGDMTIRCFPTGQLPFLADLGEAELGDFSIHTSGSYLHWHSLDLRVGASQLLQAADPLFLADVVVERYELEQMSRALRLFRDKKGLAQSEIPGLSARHVRRLEKEDVRLTAEAARKYAEAFDMSIADFLKRLGEILNLLDSKSSAQREEAAENVNQKPQVPQVRQTS